LSQKPALLSKYNNIQEQEKVESSNEQNNFAVRRNQQRDSFFATSYSSPQGTETMKLHIVYDGSAKSSKHGRSLNDSLETGPNLILHIFDMLAKF